MYRIDAIAELAASIVIWNGSNWDPKIKDIYE